MEVAILGIVSTADNCYSLSQKLSYFIEIFCQSALECVDPDEMQKKI